MILLCFFGGWVVKMSICSSYFVDFTDYSYMK